MIDFEGAVLWTTETNAESHGNIAFSPDGKQLAVPVVNGANYVDATISNTLHTNLTAKAKGTVAVGNPVFE